MDFVLQRDLLIDIFVELEARDLSNARAVCRSWQTIVDDVEVQREAFRRRWGLRKVMGAPRRHKSFCSYDKHFVKPHVCAPTDSLMGLALRFGVDVLQLRMVNNVMSDISLRSRHHIYIPVSGGEGVEGMVCRFIYDAIPIRELVVVAATEEELLSLPDDPTPKQLQDSKISSMLAKEEDSRWEAEQARTQQLRQRGQPRLDVLVWLDECNACD